MSDQPWQASQNDADPVSPFEELIGRASAAEPAAPTSEGSPFTTTFRGYDKDEVDAAFARLSARLRAETEATARLRERQQREGEAALEQSRETIARLEAELAAASADGDGVLERLRQELAAAQEQARSDVDRLEAELAGARAQFADSEKKVEALTEELVGAGGETAHKGQFEEVLRVAEDQASLIIRNATVQADRLLEAAREDIDSRRAEAEADAAGIRDRAEHDAQQARLKIDTELTAHESQLERQTASALEKIAQAEREAAAIRAEADKGAAAIRSMVARETAHARSEAEERVRELQMRSLEFEESLTRRQDDAQQEFLVLHNQAVSHAERITQDANEQVAASLDHAQRVAAKADDFDKLMRAQAQQIEADANIRAREHLDRARAKAQKIIDTVTGHTESVLRDAEDRTRQLRWQQHQLTSFMAEVKELIRPESSPAQVRADAAALVPAGDVDAHDDAAAHGTDEETAATEDVSDAFDDSSGDDSTGEHSHHDDGAHEH